MALNFVKKNNYIFIENTDDPSKSVKAPACDIKIDCGEIPNSYDIFANGQCVGNDIEPIDITIDGAAVTNAEWCEWFTKCTGCITGGNEEPDIVQIETTGFNACLVSDDSNVFVEVITNEDGTFNTYRIHPLDGGAPFDAADSTRFKWCEQTKIIAVEQKYDIYEEISCQPLESFVSSATTGISSEQAGTSGYRLRWAGQTVAEDNQIVNWLANGYYITVQVGGVTGVINGPAGFTLQSGTPGGNYAVVTNHLGTDPCSLYPTATSGQVSGQRVWTAISPINNGGLSCVEIQEIKEKDAQGNETYRFVVEDGNGNLINYNLQGYLSNTPVSKKDDLNLNHWQEICVDGVQWFRAEKYSFDDNGSITSQPVFKEGVNGAISEITPTGTIKDGICKDTCGITTESELIELTAANQEHQNASPTVVVSGGGQTYTHNHGGTYYILSGTTYDLEIDNIPSLNSEAQLLYDIIYNTNGIVTFDFSNGEQWLFDATAWTNPDFDPTNVGSFYFTYDILLAESNNALDFKVVGCNDDRRDDLLDNILKKECLSPVIKSFCVVSQGKKGKSKDTSSKPGAIIEVCKTTFHGCDGLKELTTYEINGKELSEEDFEKQNYRIVSCDSNPITYSPGAVTCATVDVEGVNVVLNCTVFTNDIDPTDGFTAYTLAGDYTSQGIGTIGDPFTPSSALTVIPCPPGSITENEECYEALNSIKGIANAGDQVKVETVTNSIAGTVLYTVTHVSSGSVIYTGSDPLNDAGLDFSNTTDWLLLAECGEALPAQSECVLNELVPTAGGYELGTVNAFDSSLVNVPPTIRARNLTVSLKEDTPFSIFVKMNDGSEYEHYTFGGTIMKEHQKCESFIISVEIKERGGTQSEFVVNFQSYNANLTDEI